jgi:DNA polymerase III epsilon subunit-like protein
VTITEALFVPLDTETGGTEPDADLLEIAARHLDAYGRTWARFSTLVRPTKPIPADARGVHHLCEADFVGAPDRDVAEWAIEQFVPREAVIVAHHAEYDRGFLPGLGDRRWLCVERLAHHLVPDAPNFKSATVYYHLGGPPLTGALHRADPDLDVTAYNLLALIDRYRDLGYSDDVDALIAFADAPYVIERWPMGPDAARGKPFEALEVGLLRWALGKDFGADLRWNVENELRRRGLAA